MMQTYAEYKDSGVDWLGEIPAGWELVRIGSRFQERREKVSDKDFEPLSVTKNGILPQLADAAKTNDGDNRKLVRKGDFVINSRSDRKGSSGVAKQDGSVSLINIVMEPNGIDPSFCNQLLKSNAFVEEYYRMGHGIVADLWTTRYSEMKTVLLALPPLPEQTAIAAFLDDKTAKIDELVGIKRRQIALLGERKQILIQNAVTKGLNPNAPMKDSGVDWIGNIPAHWEVKRLKFLCSIGTGERNTEDKVEGGKYPFFVRSQTAERINSYSYDGEAILTAGDGAGVGKVYHYVDGKFDFHQRVYKFSDFSKLGGKYLFHYISRTFYSVAMLGTAKSTVDSLRLPLIQNFWVPFPPDHLEQEAIVDFIDEQSNKINAAITIKENQITKLNEYKTTLINAAVTGKIKVA